MSIFGGRQIRHLPPMFCINERGEIIKLFLKGHSLSFRVGKCSLGLLWALDSINTLCFERSIF